VCQREVVVGYPGRGQTETRFFQLRNCLSSSRVSVPVSRFLVAVRYLRGLRKGREGTGGEWLVVVRPCFVSDFVERISSKFCKCLRLCAERPSNRGSTPSRHMRFLSPSLNTLRRIYLCKLPVYKIIPLICRFDRFGITEFFGLNHRLVLCEIR
jgi:hypothetical protein